jgi:hypothetical protein
LEIQAGKMPLAGLRWWFVVLTFGGKGCFCNGKQCFVVLSSEAQLCYSSSGAVPQIQEVQENSGENQRNEHLVICCCGVDVKRFCQQSR